MSWEMFMNGALLGLAVACLSYSIAYFAGLGWRKGRGNAIEVSNNNVFNFPHGTKIERVDEVK
jgi:hypothetical protein